MICSHSGLKMEKYCNKTILLVAHCTITSKAKINFFEKNFSLHWLLWAAPLEIKKPPLILAFGNQTTTLPKIALFFRILEYGALPSPSGQTGFPDNETRSIY